VTASNSVALAEVVVGPASVPAGGWRRRRSTPATRARRGTASP